MPLNADHIAAEKGDHEPQRQNNFDLEIYGLEGNDRNTLSLALNSGVLPTESNDEVEIQFQNERRWVAGQFNVDTLAFAYRDYVDREIRDAIMRWRFLVYDPTTGRIGLAKNYKKNAKVVMTAPDGSLTRLVTLQGIWPQSVTGGTLDMTSAEQVLIEVTFRFDKPIWALAGAAS